MSRRMRMNAPDEPDRVPQQLAADAVRRARRRKQEARKALEIAREALEIAHDRYVAACMELGRARRKLLRDAQDKEAL